LARRVRKEPVCSRFGTIRRFRDQRRSDEGMHNREVIEG